MLQPAFSHHLPGLGSCHPQKKKGLITTFPASREFCSHSALMAFALPSPQKEMTAAPAPVGCCCLLHALKPLAINHRETVPPPWLEFEAKWLFNGHNPGPHTSLSSSDFLWRSLKGSDR